LVIPQFEKCYLEGRGKSHQTFLHLIQTTTIPNRKQDAKDKPSKCQWASAVSPVAVSSILFFLFYTRKWP